jgi:hypothetical protein
LRTEHRVVLQLVPAAEVVDREQVLHGGIRLAVAGLRFLQVHGPLVSRAREELLRLLGVEILDKRIRDVLDAVLFRVRVDNRDGGLDGDRRRRDHRLVRELCLLSGQHRVLIRDRHVAVAGLEVLD